RQQFAIVGLLGERDELFRELELSVGFRRIEQRNDSGPHRVRDRARITEPLGHRHAFLDETAAAFGSRLVERQNGGERRTYTSANDAVLVGQCRECPLELVLYRPRREVLE